MFDSVSRLESTTKTNVDQCNPSINANTVRSSEFIENAENSQSVKKNPQSRIEGLALQNFHSVNSLDPQIYPSHRYVKNPKDIIPFLFQSQKLFEAYVRSEAKSLEEVIGIEREMKSILLLREKIRESLKKHVNQLISEADKKSHPAG